MLFYDIRAGIFKFFSSFFEISKGLVMKKFNFKVTLITISTLVFSNISYSANDRLEYECSMRSMAMNKGKPMSADKNLEIEGKLYPNHVKILDGEEGKKTCNMAHNLWLFVKDNYKKENFDKLNDLNKQFYVQYAKIQLRLVEGKVTKDYCRIHSFYYPSIYYKFRDVMEGNKYEPFAEWFKNKACDTSDWIQLN